MELHVEVVSEEIVKPSSSTPDQLRCYQISFIDQLTLSQYNSFIYFYPETCDTDTDADKITISDRLKQSISKSLTHFYPLAGRMTEDQLFVDCNDEGIPFVEARVKCQLFDVLNIPIPKELNKLLPFRIHCEHKVLLGIQFNIFDCAITRRETKLVAPEFESALLFPPRDLSAPGPGISQLKTRQLITKRFEFGATKVEEIRTHSKNSTQTRPTCVEAFTAFIWDCLIVAIGARSKLDTLFMIVHTVNLHPRIEPPLPESSFGNFVSIALTIPSMDSNIVPQMRESIKAMDKEYVKKLQDGYNHLDGFREKAASYGKGETVAFIFTSLCRFPLYEADFGWGKPIWTGTGDREMKNVITFIDTITSDGIEAWITLSEEEMAKFDSDEELLKYIDVPKSL
ncbi:hypothetical protein V6N12_041715 [Hibiscus sabdariffa]|uniref:Uncharacterized protein n=1 Tax=Hibiscus sabdariffa TaxID=183260 RepID=A0ABR1ZVB8_9ROSI